MRILLSVIVMLIMGFATTAQDITYLFKERAELTVTQTELNKATTLLDLYHKYPASWVNTYNSTKITLTKNGHSVSSTNSSDILSAEQKDLLTQATVDSEVSFLVKYIPENNLTNNTEKEMFYSFKVMPAILSEFVGGEERLNDYINKNIVSKLDEHQQELLKFAKLEFIVSADGSIENVKMLELTENEELNAMILKGICEMPKWNPAQQSDGQKTNQTIEFFISNIHGHCLMR